MAYPQAFHWQKPEELFEILRQLSSAELQQHSDYARQHYERHHHPDLLIWELNHLSATSPGLTPPPLPDYYNDPLQLFLENENNLTLKNILKKYMLRLVFSYPSLTRTARSVRQYWKSLSRRAR
jgi:hypothetical protein